jgi:hypothetical protein
VYRAEVDQHADGASSNADSELHRLSGDVGDHVEGHTEVILFTFLKWHLAFHLKQVNSFHRAHLQVIP